MIINYYVSNNSDCDFIQAFGFLTTFCLIALIVSLIVAFLVDRMKAERST